jgi:hypothetical protein
VFLGQPNPEEGETVGQLNPIPGKPIGEPFSVTEFSAFVCGLAIASGVKATGEFVTVPHTIDVGGGESQELKEGDFVITITPYSDTIEPGSWCMHVQKDLVNPGGVLYIGRAFMLSAAKARKAMVEAEALARTDRSN